MFRKLNEEEEKEFRTAARLNYIIDEQIKDIWHPVYQHECFIMILEDIKEKDPNDIERIKRYESSIESIGQQLHFWRK